MIPVLPFEEKVWAKPVARSMIVVVVLAVAFGLMYLHRLGPLDTGEITAAILLLLAVLPPNIAILRRRHDEFDPKKTLRPAH